MTRLLVAIVLLAACLPAVYAADAEKTTEWEAPTHWTEAQRERYRGLLEELRCLVCQNESLASSSASLAGDLRSQVREMVDEGKSDEEIKDYLVTRYGDFVLYDPPVKPSTWLLWSGPFLVLMVAVIVAWRVIRGSRSGPGETGPSEEERARARRYLNEGDE